MLNNTSTLIMASSPLEQFETTNFISFTAPILGDFIISLTNVGFYTLLVLALALGYHALAANHAPNALTEGASGTRIVPSK